MRKYEFYLVEKKPPIAWVFLNRPEKRNALNPPGWRETVPIFEDLNNDPEIRAVILTGKGACFSAGIDLLAMAEDIPELIDNEQKGGVKWRLIHKISRLQNTMSCIEWCKKPVIAAIHGYCLGAALDMAAACDIRLASEDAVFSLREVALGIASDIGSLQRVPLIVGQGISRELAFTAKDISSQRAKEILLVNEVYKSHEDLLDGAEKMAIEISENSPLAVQATKNVLNYGVGKSVAEGLDYVASISSNIIPSNDLLEAITAFAQKRKPEFSGE